MTENTTDKTSRAPLPWLLIIGLASLSLLWPLAELVGVPQGAPRALTVVAIVGAIWSGVVGFGRVPRPVLVLALTGLCHGVISVVAAVILGGLDRPVWTLFAALGVDTFWGAVAGVLALAIQQLRKAPAA